MTTAKCTSCGRAIIWATSPAGARLPLDARPAVVYRVTEEDPPQAVVVEPHIYRQKDLFSEPEDVKPSVYVSHFLTCPQASQHSKGSRK